MERQLQWLRERIKALKRDPLGLNSEDELYYDEDDYKEEDMEVEEEDRLNLDAQITREYIKQLEDELAGLRAGPDARCIKMLNQALSEAEDADVQFVFQGGQCGVRGHRGMLCAGSKVFEGMFRSGMKEARDGKIPVPPGVSLHGLRGLLEWIYLGDLFISPPFLGSMQNSLSAVRLCTYECVVVVVVCVCACVRA